MKKTPSALKCLAEMRARTAGDVARLEFHYTAVVSRLQSAKERLASLDATLRIFDDRLDPTKIPAIRTCRTRGGRPMLRSTLIEMLQASAPDAMATNDVALLVASALDVDIAPGTPVLWRRWVRDSLGNGLRSLVAEGLVERLHRPDIEPKAEGRWRWISEVQESADDLRARALATGVAVNEGHSVQAGEEPETA